MKFSRTHEMEHEKFDLTPMIDIVLLLIIFFTLTAQFASATRTQLELPNERGRETAADSSASVVVDIDQRGALTVLGNPMTLEQLTEALRTRPAAALADNAPAGGAARAAGDGAGAPAAGDGVVSRGVEFDVIIRAHQACPAVHVNRLAGALARLGVRRWRLATKGEDATPSAPASAGGTP